MTRETELAWAAGFYDGEGSTVPVRQMKRGRVTMAVTVSQKDPEVLERFAAAVGRGYLYPPFRPSASKPNPCWQYRLHRWKHCLEVMDLLWPYLGTLKREQFIRVKAEVLAGGEPLDRAKGNKTHCVRGHDFTPENTMISKAGYRQCRACHLAQSRQWKRANRARLKVMA
jgi:hypothetical protein